MDKHAYVLAIVRQSLSVVLGQLLFGRNQRLEHFVEMFGSDAAALIHDDDAHRSRVGI